MQSLHSTPDTGSHTRGPGWFETGSYLTHQLILSVWIDQWFPVPIWLCLFCPGIRCWHTWQSEDVRNCVWLFLNDCIDLHLQKAVLYPVTWDTTPCAFENSWSFCTSSTTSIWATWLSWYCNALLRWWCLLQAKDVLEELWFAWNAVEKDSQEIYVFQVMHSWNRNTDTSQLDEFAAPPRKIGKGPMAHSLTQLFKQPTSRNLWIKLLLALVWASGTSRHSGDRIQLPIAQLL